MITETESFEALMRRVEIEWHTQERELRLALSNQRGQYLVKLDNVGNPDFRQDCTRPLPDTFSGWAHVDSLKEASVICRKYISFFELGGGNWNGGEITRATDGLIVGRVSYNGRVWNPQDKEIAI